MKTALIDLLYASYVYTQVAYKFAASLKINAVEWNNGFGSPREEKADRLVFAGPHYR
jgi:hypothetical protein